MTQSWTACAKSSGPPVEPGVCPFAFTSRRQHTRCLSDWSSDVCSSDLIRYNGAMSLFKWSNAHSVYLPEIDAEHRALYRLWDELHKAVLAGADQARMQPILMNLLETAEQHFRHEERLMRAIHYTAFDWHKGQHDAVRKRSRAVARRVAVGDLEAVGELLEFLSEWLRGHMAVADRMMSARLRNYLRFNTSLAS